MATTENQIEVFDIVKWQEENPDVWGDQNENGIDLAQLRENLKLTTAERLQKRAANRPKDQLCLLELLALKKLSEL